MTMFHLTRICMVLLFIRPPIVLAQYEYDNNCTDSAILDCILDSPEYGNETYTKLNPDACQECFAATNGPLSSCPDATNTVCNNLIPCRDACFPQNKNNLCQSEIFDFYTCALTTVYAPTTDCIVTAEQCAGNNNGEGEITNETADNSNNNNNSDDAGTDGGGDGVPLPNGGDADVVPFGSAIAVLVVLVLVLSLLRVIYSCLSLARAFLSTSMSEDDIVDLTHHLYSQNF
jgi:hypothetical protein